MQSNRTTLEPLIFSASGGAELFEHRKPSKSAIARIPHIERTSRYHAHPQERSPQSRKCTSVVGMVRCDRQGDRSPSVGSHVRGARPTTPCFAAVPSCGRICNPLVRL